MLRRKFHDKPLFPDAVINTADEAASAFSADALSRYDFRKIGYVVKQGHYISVFKYNGLYAADASPVQHMYLSGEAVRHVVDVLSAPDALVTLQESGAKITQERLNAVLHEMREGLAMARTFIPMPPASAPATRCG